MLDQGKLGVWPLRLVFTPLWYVFVLCVCVHAFLVMQCLNQAGRVATAFSVHTSVVRLCVYVFLYVCTCVCVCERECRLCVYILVGCKPVSYTQPHCCVHCTQGVLGGRLLAQFLQVPCGPFLPAHQGWLAPVSPDACAQGEWFKMNEPDRVTCEL